MAQKRVRLRRSVPGVVAILVLVAIYVTGQAQVATADPASVAAGYKFQEMPIALPPGYDDQKMNTIRPVNPAYQHIAAWISSVGAIDRDERPHRPRPVRRHVHRGHQDQRRDRHLHADRVRHADRFTPFVLNAAPLPVDDTMAPTGCTPGDYNGDGRMDLLVTYWGRTPILFLAKSSATTPSPAAYQPQELVPEVSHGRQVPRPALEHRRRSTSPTWTAPGTRTSSSATTSPTPTCSTRTARTTCR